VLVKDLIDRAGVEIADPNFRRTSRSEFLQYLNKIQNKLATETRCIEVDADFNIAANVYEYPWPSSSVGMTGVRYSETPSSPDSFYWLDEKFRDEWRNMTNRLRPSGNVWAYFARTKSFEILGTPTSNIVNGGIATYWVKATRIVTETATVMEVPDFLEDMVVDGMVILGRMSGRDRVAAAQDYQRWVASLAELREKIEDRSDDRRAAIRPPSHGNPYAGMT
jgi:hypothetical protein